MATKIRLARGGRKAAPHYSIVVIESSRKQTGKFIEKIGHYHPLLNDNDAGRIVLDKDRLSYWLSVGSIPTDSVVRFMKKLGIPGHENFKIKQASSDNLGKSRKDIKAEKKAEKKAKK